jgi:hypothetical protein
VRRFAFALVAVLAFAAPVVGWANPVVDQGKRLYDDLE